MSFLGMAVHQKIPWCIGCDHRIWDDRRYAGIHADCPDDGDEILESRVGKLLVDSYAGFDSDFIIRAALMLYGDVIKSNINKQIAEELKNNWSEFKKALKNLEAPP